MILFKDVRILVVEDNGAFSQLLKLLLGKLGMQNVQTAANFDDGLKLYQEYSPELCFIDIDLGKGQKNGIALVEKIREENEDLPVIYLTAYHTLENYERCRHTRPSSFMDKEMSYLKLQIAIEMALMNKPDTKRAALPQQVAPIAVPYLNNKQFFFKIGDVYKNIPFEEIAFFYASEKMTYARVEKRNLPTNVQLKTLEEELHPNFLRIHKTYLVNINLIESINPKEGKVEIQGEQLPIGYAYRKTFMEQLNLLR